MAANIRALVSNLGDGNWGTGPLAASTDNQLDNANKTIYFPPGASKGAAPVPGDSNQSPGALGSGLVGWTSKTQWMVQVQVTTLGTDGAGNPVVIKVYAMRPTGVAEHILDINATGETSYGGFGDETIQGPVSYFYFTSASTHGTLNARCYVIGWNYGDICDGLAG
jgi:hypothetical protein